MRLPKSTRSRVWLALGALGIVAVIAFGITAYNLWQDGNSPSASGSSKDKTTNPLDGPSDYPTSEGTATPKIKGLSAKDAALLASGKGISDKNPFSSSFGDTRLHTVTIRVSGDGAVYVGYRYRDGKASNSRVISRSFSTSRSVHGPLPVAQVGVQVMTSGTYATCSILIDGVVVNSSTAHGANHVTVCTS